MLKNYLRVLSRVNLLLWLHVIEVKYKLFSLLHNLSTKSLLTLATCKWEFDYVDKNMHRYENRIYKYILNTQNNSQINLLSVLWK